MRLVSKIWDAHLRVDAVVRELRHAIRSDILILAEPGSALSVPFCILDVRVERPQMGERKIIIDTHSPDFQKSGIISRPDIFIEGNALHLNGYTPEKWDDRDIERDILNVDYDMVCRGKINKATAVSATMASRYLGHKPKASLQ